MKILVFGSSGMLGRYVSTYLKSQDYNVIDVERKTIDALLVTEPELRAKLFHLGMRAGDVVINCMGIIKQKSDIDDLQFLLVNSVFPRILANVCQNEGAEMIHPSSDCVFSGLRGLYDEADISDASDSYGRSKYMGEPSNCTVVRTSIIGEELKGKLSFIEWVKGNAGKTVNGFTNHVWNGITCLEFAKLCDEMILRNTFWSGVKHVFTKEPIVKYKLAEMVSEIFNLNVTVTPIEVPIKCDRSLTTIYENSPIVPDYREQLIDLYDYQRVLRSY